MVNNGWLIRRGNRVGLRSELDRVFGEMFGDFLPERRVSRAGAWSKGWVPSLDVSETEDGITVVAEVPGVDPGEIEVSITGDLLVISGEKKEESEEEREGYFYSERRFGSFRRAVTLPAAVDREKVAAEYDKGLLTIRLEKSEKDATKKIPVEVSKK
ncbi:MAG: Hsp20/alpha crystallin family protein [Gemmatimonadota bacterium]|nr:MAG: Hsp20/alpha crystallin family protein [Gemmatimonadota bacterium]